MKNLRQNVLILVFAAVFLSFSLIGDAISAQTKTAAKPTPKTTKTIPKTAKATPKNTPKPPAKNPGKTSVRPMPTPVGKPVKISPVKPKPTPTPAKPSATPKPKAAATPKPKAAAQIIISSASSRVRSEPNVSAETIQTVKLGSVFPIVEQNAGWYKIDLAKNETEKTGWISKTLTQSFTSAKQGEIYQKIADKYLKQSPDFSTATQLYSFLGTAADEVRTPKTAADLELKRLLALQAALKKIPVENKDESPYAAFLKANEKETVYSEPSGELLVVSREFWELHAKYKELPIGEEIAWRAAQNPLPGECEGYINCYLYLIRSTDGEYLNYYPNGKYSRQALKNITSLLDPIAADTKEKSIYVAAGDISDRADFNRYLTELRAIISKTAYIEKSRSLTLIKQIGDAHR